MPIRFFKQGTSLAGRTCLMVIGELALEGGGRYSFGSTGPLRHNQILNLVNPGLAKDQQTNRNPPQAMPF